MCTGCADAYYPSVDGSCTACPPRASQVDTLIAVIYLLLAVSITSLGVTLAALQIIPLIGGGTVKGALGRSLK